MFRGSTLVGFVGIGIVLDGRVYSIGKNSKYFFAWFLFNYRTMMKHLKTKFQ